MREPDVIDYIKELSVLTIAKKLTEITGFKTFRVLIYSRHLEIMLIIFRKQR